MQQFRITRRITGKGKPSSPYEECREKKMQKAEFLKQNRILKEHHYFKTREAAAKYIEQDLVKDPASTWGSVWPDNRTMRFAAIKYRKY